MEFLPKIEKTDKKSLQEWVTQKHHLFHYDCVFKVFKSACFQQERKIFLNISITSTSSTAKMKQYV